MWKQLPWFCAVLVFAICVSGTTEGSLCDTNNGGCGANARCYGGFYGPSSVTCVCNDGYYMGTGGCVAVNACATNNGYCDAHATCTTTLGTYSVTCTCNAPYTGNGWYCAPPPVDLCATNNGGCDAHATCYGGVGGGAVTCVCNNGYYKSGEACVAVNACATNNGGCDAHATCSTTLTTYDVTCACVAPYTGNGWYCAAPVDTPAGGNGGNTGSTTGGWDCPATPGSAFDWRYNVPTCDSLVVVYPTDLAADQANDCNIRISWPATPTVAAGTVTLNFHINEGSFLPQHTFDIKSHPNFPAGVTVYTVEWTQVGGSNCHWTGSVPCGTTPPPPPTEPSYEWTYPAPVCDTGLTVTYPSGHEGETNDVNIRVRFADQTETTLNFHQATDFTGTHVFDIEARLVQLGYAPGTQYTIVWVQVGGTNYHWEGNVPCVL